MPRFTSLNQPVGPTGRIPESGPFTHGQLTGLISSLLYAVLLANARAITETSRHGPQGMAMNHGSWRSLYNRVDVKDVVRTGSWSICRRLWRVTWILNCPDPNSG